jgi:hypothetical protein
LFKAKWPEGLNVDLRATAAMRLGSMRIGQLEGSTASPAKGVRRLAPRVQDERRAAPRCARGSARGRWSLPSRTTRERREARLEARRAAWIATLDRV